MKAAMKADCGDFDLAELTHALLALYLFLRSFVFAVWLPGWVRQGLHPVALLAQRQDRPEMGVAA